MSGPSYYHLTKNHQQYICELDCHQFLEASQAIEEGHFVEQAEC